MIYRALGKTGRQASIIGLGMEYLDNKPYEVVEEVISAAIAHGVNIADLFMPGETVRRYIGRALKGRREKLQIQGMIGSVDLRERYDISRDLDTCKRYFENLLKYLDTDYIDFGMLFFMDSQQHLDDVLRNGIYDYAVQLRQQGVIRHIGASSHNPLIAKQMVDQCMLETLLFSINPAFDMRPADENLDTVWKTLEGGTLRVDPQRAALYLACEQKGVGITVMKTLGPVGSRSQAVALQAPAHRGPVHPLRLSRPAVTSVMLAAPPPRRWRRPAAT